MTVSKVDLCNRALVRLARNRVSDIDNPTSNEEKICAVIYDETAQEVISSGSWTSIMRRVSLSQLENDDDEPLAPEFGFLYTYQLPTSPLCLHVVSINECQAGDYDFVVEGDRLLTNKASVSILYRAYITQTNSYDVNLQAAIVAKLTAELAQILTGNETKAQYYADKYEKLLTKHLSMNGQQGSNQQTVSSDLIDVR